jgi:NTP pyrophosphatase (non-canonical NTP hydrolase)
MKTAGEFTELRRLVQEFCAAREWDPFHGPKDLAIGLVTEAAELLELFRFQSESQCQAMVGSLEARAAIGAELADSLFFILRFADRFDFDLPSEFRKKMALNEAKYPVEKFRGNNQKAERKPPPDNLT